MMIKPGITELDRFVDSRYTLVSMAAKRARMIGKERLEEKENTENGDAALDKPVTQAVNEISKGVIGYVRSEAIARAKAYEQEKFNAISHFEKEKTNDIKDVVDADPFDDAIELSAVDVALSAAKGGELDNGEF